MTSNLPTDSTERKSEWPTAGARVHPELFRMVEVTAAAMKKSKSELIAEALEDYCRRLLAEHAPDILAHFEAAPLAPS